MKTYKLSISPEEYQAVRQAGLRLWPHNYRNGELSVSTAKPYDLADLLERNIDFGATCAQDVLGLEYRFNAKTSAALTRA